jgi:ribosomal protein RSM22 (predicted rRNA methylase)
MSIHLTECDPKTHHNQHLCALADSKQMLTLARKSKNGRYFCSLCGRVAYESNNVCSPMDLSQIE